MTRLSGVNAKHENSQEPAASGSESTALLSPTTKFVGIVGVLAVLATGILWISQNNQPESLTVSSPIPTPTSTIGPQPDRSGAAAKLPGAATPSASAGTQREKPPEVILDWIDYSPPECDEPRAIGVNVIEQRGQVDQVTLVWRAKATNDEHSRRMYRKGKQWTAYVRGIPRDTPVQLLAIVNGPGGETTLGADISSYC